MTPLASVEHPPITPDDHSPSSGECYWLDPDFPRALPVPVLPRHAA
jgi:hypothetical protein